MIDSVNFIQTANSKCRAKRHHKIGFTCAMNAHKSLVQSTPRNEFSMTRTYKAQTTYPPAEQGTRMRTISSGSAHAGGKRMNTQMKAPQTERKHKTKTKTKLMPPMENPLGSLGLTARETEVLTWIAQGKTNHEIGVILNACTGTICKHVERILCKLRVKNRTAAAAVAFGALTKAKITIPLLVSCAIGCG
jgi:ATP/maltotriose-dependent transcriptional regulator MalT